MHLHWRFYLETGSDSNFHCWFYLKTGSDVHAPLYKTNCRPHISIPPTHELSRSHFSHFTLTSQDIHSLSLCDLVMAPAFFNGIDMLSSPIFYLYHLIYIYIHVSLHYTFIYIQIPCIRSIFNYVATFYLEEILCIYFMFIFFFAFYRSSGINNGPPPPQEPGFHPGDEPIAPNVAITRFPVPAIVWNIFQHLLFFDANK